ncbi:MAG: hypothetical protein NC548_15650 [Lachnospiraceae bacterium]|nr:hypothetical protein [Lachnospiraceae bacterium]
MIYIDTKTCYYTYFSNGKSLICDGLYKLNSLDDNIVINSIYGGAAIFHLSKDCKFLCDENDYKWLRITNISTKPIKYPFDFIEEYHILKQIEKSYMATAQAIRKNIEELKEGSRTHFHKWYR